MNLWPFRPADQPKGALVGSARRLGWCVVAADFPTEIKALRQTVESIQQVTELDRLRGEIADLERQSSVTCHVTGPTQLCDRSTMGWASAPEAEASSLS